MNHIGRLFVNARIAVLTAHLEWIAYRLRKRDPQLDLFDWERRR